MILSFRHPDLAEIAELGSGMLTPVRRDDIAAHLRTCVRCQKSLRFVRRLKDVSPQVYDRSPPPDLITRVLSARAAGLRYILPSTDTRATKTWRVLRRIAAALAATTVLAVIVDRADLVAEAADSELRVSPARPHIGDTLRVVYRPSAGSLVRQDSLVLRARFRTPSDGMYSAFPASQVQRVAVMRRGHGGEYVAKFVLPDGVVFAALAVESPDASVVDANGTRLWEVLTYAPDGRPTFETLSQRINDMMGRSWEEGYATSRRQTELYPNRISSWSTRAFFERSLLGEKGEDSIGKAYRARLVIAAKSLPRMTEDDIGAIFYEAYSRQLRDTSAKDEFDYWWKRIRREYPRHPQVAQYLAFAFTPEQWQQQSRFILDSLERLYPILAPLSGPGTNLTNAGMQAASQARNDVAYRRWLERSLAGAGDSTIQVALHLVNLPAFRAEGMQRLRELLAAPVDAVAPHRGLTVNAREYARRIQDARRHVYVSLGRALIAEGNARAGLDTLTLASQGVWNVKIFRSLVAGYLAANDTANADRIRVKLSIDPRTPVDTAESIARRGRWRLGNAGWDSATAVARAEMHALVRDRAKLKALRLQPIVLDENGRSRTLAELTGGRPAVVIFWSRGCGAAIEALPSLIAVSQRLTASGTPVVFVNDGPQSKQVTDFLAAQNWTLPVYYDARGKMAEAFNNFGTPSYYVLDAAGRIRFDFVDEVAELIAQVAAVR